MTWSIRRRISVWLVAAMALVFAANLISSYYSNYEAANSAFDRLLQASASAIAERISVQDGALYVDLPYTALDMLASTAQDRVFYSIAGPEGTIVTGYENLPDAPRARRSATPEQLSFFDARYKGVAVRMVALQTYFSSQKFSGYATVKVAQTRGDRDELTLQLLRQSAIWTLLITLVGTMTAWVGVSLGLRPLAKLREALGRRSPDDVRPVRHNVPKEFQPLVQAINAMLHRLDVGLQSMRNFISDASHQLKTPLASLQAQSEMALRETDPDALREALTKVNLGVQRTSRLAQQLLTHARATADVGAFEPVDLTKVATEAIEALLPHADAKAIDLGYDGPAGATVTGDHALLVEMAVNLVDNAIKYSPVGATVTLVVSQDQQGLRLTVEDDGPGIPEPDQGIVFDRFVRLNKNQAEGCGLGLSIVREIAHKHGARLRLANNPGGGLRVDIDFPTTADGVR